MFEVVKKLVKSSLVAVALGGLAAPTWASDIIKSHGISTFGELKYPKDFPHLGYVNPEAPKGGEISIWAFGGFDSMHPYTIKGRAGGLSSVFFESLLAGTDDEIGAAYGLLAKEIEYPEDRSWVIFHMRPEARFSDGSTVTAADVVFSYNILLKKGLPAYRVVLAKQVETIEALDDHTVKFTFKSDYPKRDLPLEMGSLPVFSKTFYEANNRDFEASSLEPLLGSGAYVLKSVDPSRQIVYERNKNYWGADVNLNIGRNNFDEIRIEYYADYITAFEGFKGGSYTFRDEAKSSLWATGYDFPAIKNGTILKREIAHGNKATGQAFIFNLRREKFKDPRVREAISLMFNFEWTNEKFFHGLYQRINSYWDNSYLAADDLPSAAEISLLEPYRDQLPEAVFNAPAFKQPVFSSTRQLDRKAVRKAGKLLDEAGWKVDTKGIRRNAKGEALEVEFLNDSQTFDRILNPIVANLKRLGVMAVHNRVDNAEHEERASPPNYDFDIITNQVRTSYIPGTELKQYFGSESAQTSTRNKMGLSDPVVDVLIEHVLHAKTQEDLTVAVNALDRVLRAKKLWLPQWNKNKHTVAYYDMYEHPAALPPYALGQLDFWWYNAEKAEKLRASGALK
ncbi:MAG: extracellular solute-binding protein [Halocynthiibacter sp.]